ncbi:MAG: F0F1 ATP synthase subunit B [candidate division Zixibacteria bacterium]|nr:F0F1 ATP synthase subunit B [candidate division Zixibacteria bacterium]MBU1471711.1 F0F1 ATP synthase subunit B [candidate division Zixibacteria bacterium]MBU2624597.1 F0F1 ATP synthase subunit B [candidate division Zixibacteria bacterium]
MISIEWQQILTHIIGFVIALLILKKYAWKPLLGMIDERREKIQGDFDKASDELKKAEKLRVDYEQRMKEAEVDARAKIQEAIRDGQNVAAEIKDTARNEARELIERAKEELSRDVDKAKIQLKLDIVRMTLSATEKMINEKLDEAKHRQMIEGFINEVEKI